MGEVIVRKPFCKEIHVKARQFDGMITIYNVNDNVTYQMTLLHSRFKHLANEQCNKMQPLLKVNPSGSGWIIGLIPNLNHLMTSSTSLISWQCKKQTVVATSSTKAEYVAAASCCGQLWSTATLRAPELGPPAILATIDNTPYTIYEELVRSRLQLADEGGVTDLPIPDIYSGMDTLRYVTEGKLTFFKNKISPQWRFLVHTLLHCLSPKSGSWDQFGSPIAIAQICLSDGRRFNWSNYIFKGMMNNIGNAKKFLMYPRFLQTIIGIETRVTQQYKVLVFSSKLFANMRLNFAGNPMPLLPTMLLQPAAGGGAKVAAQDVPHPVPAPDQSLPHLNTPSRPLSPDPVAPILEHDHSSAHPETAAGSIPSTKNAHMGTTFHTSPLRSSHTPLDDHRSRGVEDPITLTALSSVVSTLVQKVHSLEAELKDHKIDSDEEEGTTPNVNLEALRALANAAIANDSYAATDVPAATSPTPPGTSGVATGTTEVATGTTEAATGTSGVATGTTGVVAGATGVVASASGVCASPSRVAHGDSTGSPGGSVTPTADSAVSADSPQVTPGASNKGKSPLIEEDVPVPARTFRQIEEDRLGEDVARQLHEEELATMEREQEEAHRKIQQEVLESAKFYIADDWLNIQAQVEANASLSKTLLGNDVSEDNFPARMPALIKKKRQALAEQSFKERQNRLLTPAQQKAYMRQYVKNQSSAIYNTGWSMAYVKSFSDEQLLHEFKKICKVHTQSQLHSFSRTFKRTGSTKKPKPKF
nr:ribonuclease H-like domain, reverse transcriptase, RNA-dependent DNA polymerase [Tanacetum cinerariifolium]